MKLFRSTDIPKGYLWKNWLVKQKLTGYIPGTLPLEYFLLLTK